MGVHSRQVWLCYSVLIVWCATIAVCSPVAQRPAARKRVTYPRVVTEPTTVKPAANDVADREPIEPSESKVPIDETATLPPNDTSSPLLVSLDGSLLRSMDSMNYTFNDTADPENETMGSDVHGVNSIGDTVADNLKFACEDDFLKEILALSEEDCASVMMSSSVSARNKENSETSLEEQSEEQYDEPSDKPEEPHYDR